MLNDAAASAGGPADVFSLAKVLWTLATGRKYPPSGWQSREHPTHTSSRYISDSRAHALDALIEFATHPEPARRPTMADVAKTLAAWFDPAPDRRGELDLTSLRTEVGAIIEPIQLEERRRVAGQEEAHREIQPFFFPFRPVIGDLWKALQEVGFHEITPHDVAGGNNHFCRHLASTQHWFFEYSLEVVVRDDRKRAHLFMGTNLGLGRQIGTTVPNIHAPVLGAVGSWIKLHVHDGSRWHESEKLLWSTNEEFLLATPDSEKARERFIDGLKANLHLGVRELSRAFREERL